jgi:hypothetical protein
MIFDCKKNKYSKTYFLLIEKALARGLKTRSQAKKILGYVERHHIQPKCIGGQDVADNLVFLTAKEHFICHRLLTRMFDDVEISRKLRFALNKMARKSQNQKRIKISSVVYQKMREDFSKDMSDMFLGKTRIPLTEEHKLSISKKLKGVPKSEAAIENMKGPKSSEMIEHLRKLAAFKKGIPRSEEDKQKMRKPKSKESFDSYSKVRKGIVSAYDLMTNRVVKISRETFLELRNERYVGINSKLIQKTK